VIFRTLAVAGAFLLEPERLEDERGFFARTWCHREAAAQGLNPRVVQCNLSFNHREGTLRGLHYQLAPHQEAKLVRCSRGALHDVVVDLRPDSPTFLQHAAVVLSADDRRMVYVPEGCAHGFQTLEDDTEVFYQMSERYVAEASRGVRWNDPAFGIHWPRSRPIMNARDASYPDFVSRVGIPG
jgi:dTDP-4-dehydrorhamnose 3,5-epimerase